MRVIEVLTLDCDFVRRWCNKYNEIFGGSYDEIEEKAIRSWLSKLGEPKYLNREYFVRLGRWKTKRQTSNYESNNEDMIIQVTRSAYQASDALTKLRILKRLRGVGVAVAGTILHYLHPDKFAIFDYHARATLKRANLWMREVSDSSDQAWLEYKKLMTKLAERLEVSLRDLDKALFAYDKYGMRVEHEGQLCCNMRIRQKGELKTMGSKHLCEDIIRVTAKVGIDPFRTPFTPGDLGFKASDYGSFADWCSHKEAKSGKWNKHICLKVAEWTRSGKPKRYILLPRQQWQDC